MTEPADLDARAAALRALATQVEDVADTPARRAADPVWQCEHAETVREALRQQRRAAESSAQRLREHARQLAQQAQRIREERAAEARREAARQEAAEAREEAAKKAREDAPS